MTDNNESWFPGQQYEPDVPSRKQLISREGYTTRLEDRVFRLEGLLQEARQYVADTVLLAKIDAAVGR